MRIARYKNVLITGGSKGIGEAIAKRFYEGSYQVIICSRSDEHHSDLMKKYPEAGRPGIDCRIADISVKSSVERLCHDVLNDYGQIDILVNNAAICEYGGFLDYEDAQFEQLMNVNLFGAYYMIRGIVPTMIKKGGGTVFNICSTASKTSYPNLGPYCATKHAMYALSQGLRLETQDKNIRVITMMPGLTATPAWNGKDIDTSGFMQPSEIGDLVFDINNLNQRTVVEEITIRPMGLV